jgi:hypothetical protein
MSKLGEPHPRRLYTIDIFYACDHVITYRNESPPKVGDEVYCTRCNRATFVVRPPNTYRVNCKSCQYNRTLRNEKLKAQKFAINHLKKYSSHVVEYWEDETLEHVYQHSQPRLVDEDIPF